LLLCLRLACILCRTRSGASQPQVLLSCNQDQFRLGFPGDWLSGHPLTVADLETEQLELQALGMTLEFGPDRT